MTLDLLEDASRGRNTLTDVSNKDEKYCSDTKHLLITRLCEKCDANMRNKMCKIVFTRTLKQVEQD